MVRGWGGGGGKVKLYTHLLRFVKMEFFRFCDMFYPARPPKLPPGDQSIGDPWYSNLTLFGDY